jgi:hypothetical protein|tara:strand:- start:14258 stop:14779 length:522 start_codon:yes stop_codon:yes gene_type:complete
MQTRREILQGLIVSVGGASMLAACGGMATVTPTNPAATGGRFFSERELTLVSRVADLLIPRTETPGALDVNVPGFLDGFMFEWAGASTKRFMHLTVTELDDALGAAFVTADATTAERTLSEFDSRAFADGSRFGGYRNLKGLITQAYFATEEGALLERKWVAVPGRWDPCVEL